MDEISYKYMKKRPIQARAKETVAVILEATAQLLQDTTPDALTTAAISERAGVSVGSIYQYFESKDSLIAALAHDTVAQINQAIRETLIHAAPDDLEAALPPIIDGLLQHYRERPDRMGFLVSYLVTLGEIDAVEQPLHQLQGWLTEFLITTDNWRADVAEIRVRIVVQGVSAAIRNTLQHHPEDVDNPVFRRELIGFLRAMLRGSDAEA